VSQCQSQHIPLWQCGFTSWGHDSVDVAAPGVDILSTVKAGLSLGHTYPNDEYFDGTSMAAPMVAGIAGLVRSEHPAYSAVQIKNAIMHAVIHPASLKLYDAWGPEAGVGKALLTGHFTRTQGRVNARRALTSSNANATPLTDGNTDGAKAFTSPTVGHVSWPADANDVYKRKLQKGIRYQVVLNGPSGSDMDLWVWRPGTTEIFQFTPGCFVKGGRCPALQAVSGGRTADEKVTFRAPKTGVFYIQVNGWYSGGRYTLTFKKV
jgi:subtilisin family serine protease